MLDMGSYSYPDSDCSLTSFFNTLSDHNNNKIQRRFTNQQIKSLETIFQSESKLEPRKKLEVAKDLGLKPRQVAIWFQNKRARWRSKQLERDYNVLQASFNSLSSRYDLLHRENQSLTHQLNRLRERCNTGDIIAIEEKACEANYGSMKLKEECVEDEKNINMVSDVNNNLDDLECDQVFDDDKWWDLWS